MNEKEKYIKSLLYLELDKDKEIASMVYENIKNDKTIFSNKLDMLLTLYKNENIKNISISERDIVLKAIQKSFSIEEIKFLLRYKNDIKKMQVLYDGFLCGVKISDIIELGDKRNIEILEMGINDLSKKMSIDKVKIYAKNTNDYKKAIEIRKAILDGIDKKHHNMLVDIELNYRQVREVRKALNKGLGENLIKDFITPAKNDIEKMRFFRKTLIHFEEVNADLSYIEILNYLLKSTFNVKKLVISRDYLFNNKFSTNKEEKIKALKELEKYKLDDQIFKMYVEILEIDFSIEKIKEYIEKKYDISKLKEIKDEIRIKNFIKNE